jgi:hypothetical protein
MYTANERWSSPRLKGNAFENGVTLTALLGLHARVRPAELQDHDWLLRLQDNEHAVLPLPVSTAVGTPAPEFV